MAEQPQEQPAPESATQPGPAFPLEMNARLASASPKQRVWATCQVSSRGVPAAAQVPGRVPCVQPWSPDSKFQHWLSCKMLSSVCSRWLWIRTCCAVNPSAAELTFSSKS